MVGNYSGEEKRMQESMAAFVAAKERNANAKMVDGYNLLRDALVWFESHSVEEKLGHLPQWVEMARHLTAR
jgi:hypothetical protein